MQLSQIENEYYLKPGYLIVSRKPYILRTVLGSCVSVCLWNRVHKYGGMNHYIYDVPGNDEPKPIYGSVSTPYMISLMEKLGSRKSEIDAYVIGGSKSKILISSTVGSDNIRIAKRVLKNRNIRIKRTVLNSNTGKKVIFNTHTGELIVRDTEKYREDYWHE